MAARFLLTALVAHSVLMLVNSLSARLRQPLVVPSAAMASHHSLSPGAISLAAPRIGVVVLSLLS